MEQVEFLEYEIDCKGVKYKQIPLGKSTNLSGKRYGRLVCKNRVQINKTLKSRDSFWLCECDCGNKVVASAHSLNKGETLSCGCVHSERVSNTSKKDETGNIYHYLTVIDKAPSINGRAYWWCRCRCGNEFAVRGHSLRSGNTLSCGCYHKEKVREISLKNEIGNRYGKLTVIDEAESIKYSDGSIYSNWKCLCDCGNIVEVLGTCLRSGNTQSCGCMISKGETIIASILQNNNISFIPQYSFNDCLSTKQHLLRFDFAIIENNNLNCLIEYQGIQHYEETGWDSPIENDILKKEYCRKNNIRLIEIPYWDYSKLNNEYLINLIQKEGT